MSNGETTQRSMVDKMPILAEEFVQAGKNAGIVLDYKPRTLPLADKFLNSLRTEMKALVAAKDSQASALYMKNMMWITAYLGEVIRRETGGVWFESDKLLLVDVGADQHAHPLAIVTSLFDHGRALVGGVNVESTKAYCELITRAQQQWLDRTLLGSYESMASLRTSMAPDAKTAGLLVGQAQMAVATAKLKWLEALDFTPDSLDAVERILGRLHDLHIQAPPGQGASDEQIAAMSKVWGVYVGEVLRRHYGGQWRIGDDKVLELHIGEATVFPAGKVRKRIVDGPADNIRFYFTAMAKVLAS